MTGAQNLFLFFYIHYASSFAVSYTHLDVYKRQLHHLDPAPFFRQVRAVEITPEGHRMLPSQG